MRPLLYSFRLPVVGDVDFPAYYTLLVFGLVLAAILTVRQSRRLGLDPDLILKCNLWMAIWGLIGSRLLHLIADGHFHDYVNLCVDPTKVKAIDALVEYCTTAKQCGYEYLCNAATHKCYPPKDCWAALEFWRGGYAYYGGFLAAVPFSVWFCRRHRLPWWQVADLASPAIALGLIFGRIGCFLNGCCYGKVTHSAVGVVFPTGGTAWRAQFDAGLIGSQQHALPVHPTQLYESFLCLLVFAALFWLVRPRKRFDGEVFAGLLILYGIARFAVEFFRDDDRGVFFGNWLSTSQLISIPLIIFGILILQRGRRAAKMVPVHE